MLRHLRASNYKKKCDLRTGGVAFRFRSLFDNKQHRSKRKPSTNNFPTGPCHNSGLAARLAEIQLHSVATAPFPTLHFSFCPKTALLNWGCSYRGIRSRPLTHASPAPKRFALNRLHSTQSRVPLGSGCPGLPDTREASHSAAGSTSHRNFFQCA